MIIVAYLVTYRVEGKGAATITDVIYSSKERTEKEEAPSGSKEQYQAVKVLEYIGVGSGGGGAGGDSPPKFQVGGHSPPTVYIMNFIAVL